MNQITGDNGIFRLYDGTIVYIEEIQYSHDGIHDWETNFEPYTHNNTITGIGTLEGHKYRRVRHAGTTYWQKPEYIVAEDGQNIQLRTTDEYLQYKLENETEDEWKNILLLDNIKGSDGRQGIPGTGMHIDKVGIFDTKGSCCDSTPVVSTGCGCNNMPQQTTTTYNGAFSIFLSTGNHMLNDTEDTGKYFSNDGVTWTLYVSSTHKGQIVVYWNGTTNTGTGAYTVLGSNIVQGSSGGVDTYGKFYSCVNGQWIYLSSIAANDHMVQEEAGSTHIGYMDTYVTTPSIITGINTIGLKNGLLEIIDESITTEKFDPTVFNDGLENTGTEINVDVDELIGFGIKEDHTLTVENNNFAVDTPTIIHDGLTTDTADVNGNQQIIVNVTDFITPTTTIYTGLADSTTMSVTETDGHKNMYVRPYEGIEVVALGVSVKDDNLSLIADTTNLRVKPYGSGNDGILHTHLNPLVCNENYGIEKNGTDSKLHVKVDNVNIGFDGTGRLTIPNDGVHGVDLNGDTCNELKGIQVLNDQLIVKVDGTTIGFDSVGQLQLYNDYLTNRAVTGITDNVGTPILRNLVPIIPGTPTSFVSIETKALNTNKLEIKASVNNSILDTVVGDLGYIKSDATGVTNSGSPADWDTTGEIKTYIDAQDDLYVLKNHQYSNAYYRCGTPADGLYIRLGTTDVFARLEADANGNLALSETNKISVGD